MESMYAQAQTAILLPAEITTADLEAALLAAKSSQADQADIFCQDKTCESWSLENGVLKSGKFAHQRGFGLRVVQEAKAAYAYADTIDKQVMMQAAQSLNGRIQLKVSSKISPIPLHRYYLSVSPLPSLPDLEKRQLLEKMDKWARAMDPRVDQVFVDLSSSFETVLMAHSDGTYAADQRPMVRLQVSVIVVQGKRQERGSSGGGGRFDYGYFDDLRAKTFVEHAVKQALAQLEASPAPAGLMPVVLGSGWPGVLLHEAVGHGLEADACRKGMSAFSDKMGQVVASSLCTIVDNGTLEGHRGSLNVDDEGVPSSCTTLIENGVCVGLMQDRLNAALMGQSLTGNGRRESYACMPMPRMTNTYMLPGESELEEMIASCQRGLFAVDFSGGQVDTTTGQFVFCASEAYLIENGRVGAPVKGATLTGSGPEVLKKVSMVGNDLDFDRGIGVCGKNGQSVAVTVGQPSLKVDELVVGGQMN